MGWNITIRMGQIESNMVSLYLHAVYNSELIKYSLEELLLFVCQMKGVWVTKYQNKLVAGHHHLFKIPFNLSVLSFFLSHLRAD